MTDHSRKVRPFVIGAALLATVSGCDGLFGRTEAEHVQRAKEFQQTGDYRSSVIELKSALQQNPDNAEARLLLGRMNAVAGNAADAEKDLRRAMQLGVPRDQVLMALTEAMLRRGKYQAILDEVDAPASLDTQERGRLIAYRGESWLLLKQLDKATAEYQRALQINPKSPLAKLGLARLAMARSEQGRALDLLDEAIQLAPNEPRIFSVQGDFYHFLGDQKKAEASFSKAIELQPLDYITRLKRAMVRTDAKDFAGAEADIQTLKDKVPQFYLVYHVDGLKAFAQKQYPEAQTAFEEALKRNSKYAESRYYLSGAHLLQGHLSQAEENINAFLSQFPNSNKGRRVSAEIRYKLEDYKGAEQILARLIDENPEDSAALRLMGNIQFALGHQDKGMAYLQEMVKLEPDSAGARARLGLGKLLGGDKAEGLKELHSAVQLNPELAEAKAYIAYTHIQAKEFDQARQVIEGMRAQQSDSPLSYNLLGVLYMAQNDIENARSALQIGLKKSPGAPAISHSLAQLAVREGQLDQAQALYEGVLKMHPKHLRTQLKLAELDAQRGFSTKVEARLTEAINENPQNLQPRLVLASYLFQTGSPGRSQVMLEAVQGDYPESEALLAFLSKVQLANHEPDRALDTARTLVKVAPDSAPAQFALAQAYDGVGEARYARKALEHSLKLNPEFFLARVAMVKVLVAENHLKQARAGLSALQKTFAGHPEVLSLQAWMALQQKQPKAAIELYRQLLKQVPNHTHVTALADAQWRSGDRDGALKTLADWSQDYPQDARIYYLRSSLYQSIGNNQEARALLKQAIELNPNNAAALNNLAWMLRKDDPEQAHRYAEQAVALDSQPQMLDTLAMILLEKSRFLDAVRLLEQATGKAPNDPSLQYHLALAQTRSGQTDLATGVLRQLLSGEVNFAEKAEAQQLLSDLSQ